MNFLENGNSDPMRSYGGKQVVNLAQSSPEFIGIIIHRVLKSCISTEWKIRISANEAYENLLRLFITLNDENEILQMLNLRPMITFENFNVETVIKRGLFLYSQSDELVENNKNSIITSSTDLNQKISAKQLCKSFTSCNKSQVLKRKENNDNDVFLTFELLIEYLMSPNWTERHGSALCLNAFVRTLFKKMKQNEKVDIIPQLTDLSLRSMIVMLLDRYGDYMSCDVVAPVKEVVGQLLGQLIHLMSFEAITGMMKIFDTVFEMNKLFEYGWQMVHSCLIATKYAIHACKEKKYNWSPKLVEMIYEFFIHSFGKQSNGEGIMIDDVVAEICTIWLSILGESNFDLNWYSINILEMLMYVIEQSDELDESCSAYEKVIELVAYLVHLLVLKLRKSENKSIEKFLTINSSKISTFFYTSAISSSKDVEISIIKGTTDLLCFKMSFEKKDTLVVEFWCHVYYLLYLGITTPEIEFFLPILERSIDSLIESLSHTDILVKNQSHTDILVENPSHTDILVENPSHTDILVDSITQNSSSYINEMFELITIPTKTPCKSFSNFNEKLPFPFFPIPMSTQTLESENNYNAHCHYISGFDGPFNVSQLNQINHQRLASLGLFTKIIATLFTLIEPDSEKSKLSHKLIEIVHKCMMSDTSSRELIASAFLYNTLQTPCFLNPFSTLIESKIVCYTDKFFNKTVADIFFHLSNQSCVILADLNESIIKFSNIFLKYTNYQTLSEVKNSATLRQMKIYFGELAESVLSKLQNNKNQSASSKEYCISILNKICQLEKTKYINCTRIQLFLVLYFIGIKNQIQMSQNLSWYIIPMMDAFKFEDSVKIVQSTQISFVSFLQHQISTNNKNPIDKIFKNICVYIQNSYVTNIPVTLENKLKFNVDQTHKMCFEIDQNSGIFAICFYHLFIINDLQDNTLSFPISYSLDCVKLEKSITLKNSCLLINELILNFFENTVFINCIEGYIFNPILNFSHNIEIENNEESVFKKLFNALVLFQLCYQTLNFKFQTKTKSVLELICHHLLSCKRTTIRTLSAFILAKVYMSMEPTYAVYHLHTQVLSDEIDHLKSNKLNSDDEIQLYKKYGRSELVFYLLYLFEENNNHLLKLSLVVKVIKNLMDHDVQVAYVYSIVLSRLMECVPILIERCTEFNEIDVCNVAEEQKDYILVVKEIIQEGFRFMCELSMPSSNSVLEEMPFELTTTLRPYQIDGINWLLFLQKYNLNGALCDDMGLGKTIQTIVTIAITHFRQRNSILYPTLIVCPPILISHWVDEFERFLPKDLLTVTEFSELRDLKKLENDLKNNKFDIIVTSYYLMKSSIDKFKNYMFNYVVLDEAHIVKNKSGKLFTAVKMLKSNYRTILTGTPIQNSVVELWTLFDFLMPNFLNSFQLFSKRYARPIAKSFNPKCTSKVFLQGQHLLANLHKQVLPFILRRTKGNVLKDLPDKIIQTIYCNLSPFQQILYDNAVQKDDYNILEKKIVDLSLEINETKNPHIFQMIYYLRRVCNHPALVFDSTDNKYSENLHSMKTNDDINVSTKFVALIQLLEDLGIYTPPSSKSSHANSNDVNIESLDTSNHRALIFSQTTAVLDIIENDLLKKYMPDVKYLRLDGSVRHADRYPLTKEFNSNSDISLLLLTTSVGSLGLNLVGADVVIFYDHDWNPMKDLQAMDRAHRIGQTKTVNVFRIVVKNTIEERILSLQNFKMKMANTIINESNSDLNKMRDNDIIDVFGSSSSNPQNEIEKNEFLKQKRDYSKLSNQDHRDFKNHEEYGKQFDLKKFSDNLK